MVCSVNPGSFLGSKMVKEAYGKEGQDIAIGANILVRAATSPEFEGAHGRYYDNDNRRFADPHPGAEDEATMADLMAALESFR